MVNQMKMKKILFVPDVHRPYHDKKAWSLLLKAGKFFAPDYIVILGDFIDCYCVSAHDKNPSRARNIEYEFQDARKGLGELSEILAPEGIKIYLAGNHEDRLERYLFSKAPELSSIVRLYEQLDLNNRGWKYVPYKQHFKLGKIYMTHDTGRSSPTAHLLAQADFQDNIVIGHTHRMSYTICGNGKGKPHVATMFGWLGDINKVDYLHKIQAMRAWALGFGIGYMEPNGKIHCIPVPIIENKVIIEGHLFTI